MNTMKKKLAALLAASTCAMPLGSTASAWAQPAGGELVQQDFENNEPGWGKFSQPQGAAAQVGISREAENVHGGAASLQFNYSLQPRQLAALVLANTTPLSTANKISFWAKASAESTMAFAIQERGGGLWTALFHLPEAKWQQVVLTPGDFSNSSDLGGKPDADGKLALDSIQWAGIGDFSQFLLADPNSPLLKIFRVTPGPRTLWLDDVAFDPTKPAPVAAGKPVVVDDFSSPQLGWLGLADTTIAREERSVDGAKQPGLALSYPQSVGKFGGVVRQVNAQGWAGATRLALSLASSAPANIVLQLDERGGGKYLVPIAAAGDGEARALSFGLSQFKPADDSRDDNGKLDMDQVQRVLVLDAAAVVPGAARDNTLWIGNITAQK